MRTAGLAMMAYYYFDFRDVKKQDRYGLSPLSFRSFQRSRILVIKSSLSYIQVMLAERESPVPACS